MTKNETRLFLLAILAISVFGLVNNSMKVASAQATFDFGVTLNGYSISLAPNHSAYVEVTVSLVSGTPQNVTLTSTVSPQDAELSTLFAQSWGYPTFVTTLIVSALDAQPGKQYQIIIAGTSQGLTRSATPLTVTIACTQGTCAPPSATLTTAIVGEGSVSPSCPSGCSEAVGLLLNVTASAAPSWTFSGWNVTGTSCSNGLNGNPCDFKMPNNAVSITANFVQYQTLYTSYTGIGQLTPACPSGCQVRVGSSVSILATPGPGWQVSGYHLTQGISCGLVTGYVCSFTMPTFPVSFQVTFTEISVSYRQTILLTTTITTSVTSATSVYGATTSTASVTTVSVTVTGTTEASTLLSTSSGFVTLTQTNLVTQVLDVTTSATSVMTAVGNPPLELALACVIIFSLVVMGISVVRRSGPRRSVQCPRCAFNNPSARIYCVNCGEPLKGS